MVEPPELAGPHLVLADSRTHDRVVGRIVAEGLEHVLGLQGVAGDVSVVGEREVLEPARHRALPRRTVGLGVGCAGQGEPLDQRLGGETGIGLDGHVGMANLVELGRVDVDVDHRSVGCETIELAGDAVVESGTDGDEEIGFLHGGDRRVRPVHAGHPQRQGVIVGEPAATHEGGHHVDVGELGQGPQRVGAARLEYPAARVDDGPLGGEDHLDGLADALGVGVGEHVVAGQVVPGGDVVGEGRTGIAGVDDVLGDVDQHRPGSSRRGQVEGIVDHLGDVGGLGDEEVVLGDRHGDAGGVALLEGVGSDGGVGHLTGDCHHRHRVEVGVAQRGDDVGGRGATGDHGHARLAGRVRIPLGHVARTLLVADQDVANRRVDQWVVHGQNGATGKAEHHIDTLTLEGVHQRLAAVGGAAVRAGRAHGATSGSGIGRGEKRKRPPSGEVGGRTS